MKKEYDVCSGLTIVELNRIVNDALEDGWECQGGISVAPYDKNVDEDVAFEGLIFHQAIVREVKEENQEWKFN